MKNFKLRSLFTALIAAIWAAPLYAEPLDLTSRPVDLHTGDETIATVGALQYLGGIELRSRHPNFGGLSGMDISKDGKRMSLVTDKGWRVTLQPVHDQRGHLIGVQDGQIGKLLMPSGAPISDSGDGDGEAIARHRGAFVVSFESDKKLYLYPPGENPLALKPRALRLPSAIGGAPSNGQIEALTTLKGGRIFALTERFSHGEHAVIGWITQNRAWHHVIYQRSGKFFPTGAATLPDGDVILLERRFNWLAGVASRIVRISTKTILPGAMIRGIEIAVLDPPFIVENFEAIDIRVGPAGETLVYILSDDNFQSIQRNLLLLFKLKE